ncbi:MAG: phenylalanine--tRNA ligase subunit alpha, partial [Rhodocyclaceae bacterium]|nr:phenylalanine--tRNA ligase subunit alpha [Rhodocyclaceae bacterium]
MSDIDQLVAQATAEFAGIEDASALEQAKARFLGKSGSITELLKGLGKLDPEARKTAGAAINS